MKVYQLILKIIVRMCFNYKGNHILRIKADSLQQIIFWCNLKLVNDVETLVDFISSLHS